MSESRPMRKLILRNGQLPGDVVMLTAAVRELKRALGTGVEIDVRTPCPALWENNPHLTPLADGAGELSATSFPKWGFGHASLGRRKIAGPRPRSRLEGKLAGARQPNISLAVQMPHGFADGGEDEGQTFADGAGIAGKIDDERESARARDGA